MVIVLHITGIMDRAGAETMIMNLYREIDRTKIQFDFVFFGDKKGDYEEEIYALGGKIYRISTHNPIKRSIALKKLLNKNPQYRIVHSHTLLNNGLNLLIAKWAKVPHRIAHAHSTNDISDATIARSIYKSLALKLIKLYATQFISCSKEAAEFLFPNQTRVFSLPNSINLSKFAEIGENYKYYLNREFNLDDSCLKIIQVGRLQIVKNHKATINLAKMLKEKGIKFKMFFVGQGELQEEIKENIQFANLQNEIIMLGLRTDIPHIMAGADIMLLPSFYEGFPVVLVESQAVGLPAIVSDTISSEVDLGVDLVEFFVQ